MWHGVTSSNQVELHRKLFTLILEDVSCEHGWGLNVYLYLNMLILMFSSLSLYF